MTASPGGISHNAPTTEEDVANPERVRGLLETLYTKVADTLGGREAARLLLLLVPLVIYDLVLSISRLSPEGGSAGPGPPWSEVAVATLSSALFGLGYAVFWIGVYALSPSKVYRLVVSLGLSMLTFLVFAFATASTVYSQEFGSTLGYGVLRATLSNPGDIIALTEVVPRYMMAIFVEVFVYALFGTWLIAYVAEARGYVRSAMTRTLSPRGSLAGCTLGIALCGLSLVPGLLGAKGSTYADQAIQLATTTMREHSFGGSDWDVQSPLAEVSLEETTQTERRNVVLVHLESVRASSTTPYNKDIETTPYLDSLASESLLAERAYTPVPYSSKALVSVNCGMYPSPATEIRESERPGAIPARCLPQLLGDNGYRTAWFQSSWQDFENWPQLVENFGYSEFYPLDSMDREGFEKANPWSYEDDIMLEPSREWLEENGGEPFVVSYVTGTPHHEYLAPKRYGHLEFPPDDRLDEFHAGRFNRYLNSVRYVDFFVKNLIEQYKELGLYEDTIFVFYGDHGQAFQEHGLKTHGPTPYDEALRVPLLIHDPQRFRGGETISGDTPVNHLDIAPTVVEMLGFEVEGGEYPGNSLLQPVPQDRTLMFNCRPDVECAASLQGYDKYIYFYGRKPDELYDLRQDPFEQNNLAEERGDSDLEGRSVPLLEWRLRMMAMYR